MKLFQTSLFGAAFCYTGRNKVMTRSELSFCGGDTVGEKHQHTVAIEGNNVTTFTTKHGSIIDNDEYQGILGALSTLVPVNLESWCKNNNRINRHTTEPWEVSLSYINGDVSYAVIDNGDQLTIEATDLVTHNSLTLSRSYDLGLNMVTQIDKRRVECHIASTNELTVANVVLNLFASLQKYFPYTDNSAVTKKQNTL